MFGFSCLCRGLGVLLVFILLWWEGKTRGRRLNRVIKY